MPNPWKDRANIRPVGVTEGVSSCFFSAWKDRPQCFQTGLRCPVWRVELGHHPGKRVLPELLSANMKSVGVMTVVCVCLQYELATGRFPYPKWNSVFDQLTQVVKGEPPQLSNSEERQFSPKFINFVNLWWAPTVQRVIGSSFQVFIGCHWICWCCLIFLFCPALQRTSPKGQSTESFWWVTDIRRN